MPIFYKLKVFTAYEYLEKRFDLKTRVLASTLFILLKCFYTAVAICAPALVIAEMTGLPPAGICLGIGALNTLYATVEGMRAVIWTDTPQLAVLLAGLVIACVKAVGHVAEGLREISSVAYTGGKLRFLDRSMWLWRGAKMPRLNPWALTAGTVLPEFPGVAMDALPMVAHLA